MDYVRPQNIIKLIGKKNIGKKLHGIGLGNSFLAMTPNTQATKANINIDKWDFIILKNFCASKETIMSTKATHRMGENTSFDKKLIPRFLDGSVG